MGGGVEPTCPTLFNSVENIVVIFVLEGIRTRCTDICCSPGRIKDKKQLGGLEER